MRRDRGDLLTIGVLAAIAGAGAWGVRRGGRNAEIDGQIDRALELVPELVLQWVNHAEDSALQDPGEVEDFYLSDMMDRPSRATLAWWKQETGLTYIGHGNQRVAFRLSDGSVLKLALDHVGEESNELEMETWQEAQGDPDVLDLLVPMLAGNERFIHMAGADPLSATRLQGDPRLAERFRERFRVANTLAHEGRLVATDLAVPKNWGIHEGRIKILDYEAGQ